MEAVEKKGAKPFLRLVQPETDANGAQKFRSVGGIWKNTDKKGQTFYVVRIGSLRLLGFEQKK